MELFLLCLLALPVVVQTYYVPIVSPRFYKDNDPVQVNAVKLTSRRAQLPYDYYSLPFCVPSDGPDYSIGYLSSNWRRGSPIASTLYETRMKENIQCKLVCGSPYKPLTWSTKDQYDVANRIQQEYYIHLSIDNIPSVSVTGNITYEEGFKIGFVDRNGNVYVFNHLHFILYYQDFPSRQTSRIIGFQVEPASIMNHHLKFLDSTPNNCKLPKKVYTMQTIQGDQKADKSISVYFTYSVSWKSSFTTDALDWDTYQKTYNIDSHNRSVLIPIITSLGLVVIVAIILIRTLRKECQSRMTPTITEEFSLNEIRSWKFVHGDVFRPPVYPICFVTIVGSGISLFGMTLSVIYIDALTGFTSIARRYLTEITMFYFGLFGFFSGFIGGYLYKKFGGIKWKIPVFMTGIVYPLFIFGSGFIVNMIMLDSNSCGVVQQHVVLMFVVEWFGVYIPLVYTGYHYANKIFNDLNPCITNVVARYIPSQPWYLWCPVIIGVIPFAAILPELFFVHDALWLNQTYRLFEYPISVYLVSLTIVANCSIISTYTQLCNGNYKWWWRTVFLGVSCSVYMMGFSMYYYHTALNIIGWDAAIIYVAYSLQLAVTYGLIASSVAFMSSYLFILLIYGSLKID